jgi:flagellar protein FlgJ
MQIGHIPSDSGIRFGKLSALGEDLWWPPNKGVLLKGEQRATKEALLEELQGKKKSLSAEEEKELRQACQDFESFFLYYLLKVMDKTIPREGGIIQDSHTMRMYREMWYERLADTMAQKGMGLGEHLFTQVSQSLLNRVYK